MPGPVTLVLLSALLHALWNLGLKRHPDPNAGMTVVAGISGTVGLACALGEAALGYGPAFSAPRAVGLALSCGVSESLYFLALGRALRDASLGTSYTVVRGGGVLLVWPLAFVVQGEVPTWPQVAGIAVMLSGLGMLFPHAEGGDTRAGYLWALAGAQCVALNHVLYKAALGAGGRPWAVFATAMAVATPATVGLMGRRTTTSPAPGSALPRGQVARLGEAWRAGPVLLGVSGLMCGVSFGLALLAMRTAGAAWVGTLRNASVALAPILAWGILGERPRARTVAGFALVLCAVVLLAR